MPIRKLSAYNPEAPFAARPPLPGTETHVGFVLERHSAEVRIMSDVWATGFYAIVWDPTTGSPQTITLGNDEFGCDMEAEVDATPEVRHAHNAWVQQKEEAAHRREEAAAEAAAEKRLLKDISKGVRVMVVNGRKVKKGTEGKVFWIGMGGYGSRIGFEDDAGTVHWTALDNVIRVLPPKPEGMSWGDFERHLYRQRAERMAA